MATREFSLAVEGRMRHFGLLIGAGEVITLSGDLGAGKTTAALLVNRTYDVTGGRVTIVRPFTVAGEGQRPGMALAQWIAAAREGRPLRLLGHPGRSRDITDVRDATRALVDLGRLSLDGFEGADGTVNLGTGVARTLRELADAVAAEFGVEVRTVLEPSHPAEVDHTLADVSRLRSLLGWVPSTDLADLVTRQAAAEVPALRLGR